MAGKIIPRIRLTPAKVVVEVEAELGNNRQIQLELCTAWLQLISVLLVSSSDQRKDRRPSLILSIGPQTAAQHKIMLAISLESFRILPRNMAGL